MPNLGSFGAIAYTENNASQPPHTDVVGLHLLGAIYRALGALAALTSYIMTMFALGERDLKKILVALSLYLTSLFAANTLGLKLMPFLFGGHISVAILSFPIVFLMTDVIGEVYGKRVAKLFVLAGFVSTLLFLLYSLASLSLPWAAEGLWAKEGYEQMFGTSVRVAIASLAAFLIAEYQDVLTFFFFKTSLGERSFWLRSMLSNLWSQLLDSAIFMVIAFLGTYDARTLFALIVSWWLYKVCIGCAYTPLAYVGIRLLQDGHAR